MPKPPFITRVKLRNYKSIARCDVALGPLAVLVGPNGSGKSNFLDALCFTYVALRWPLDEVLRERGGMREVLRRSGERIDSFDVSLDFVLPGGAGEGRYCFELTRRDGGGVAVSKEVCAVRYSGVDGGNFFFTAQDGEVVASNLKSPLPRVFPDRLALVSASSHEGFRPVYDALTEMHCYRFTPGILRTPQTPESGAHLHSPSGHNLPAVLGFMEQNTPQTFERIQRYMKAIVPGLEQVGRLAIPVADLETIQFIQQIVDWNNPLRFTAINMSDGTLRALAILTALLQDGDSRPTLIELEEPEIALHPAAAGVLWDVLTDGAERAQVLVSTQSPDLLDRKDVPPDAILSVAMEAGRTEIAPISESSRQILQERLATPGELLRQNALSSIDQSFYPQSILSNPGGYR